MDLFALYQECAPRVHPETMAHIVQHESRGNPWALNVNGVGTIDIKGAAAIEAAQNYLIQGYTVDVGLGQINSENFTWLGLDLDTAFDPCTNIKAAATVLTENYLKALPNHESPEAAMDEALSRYNTGDAKRGLKNGYVEKVRNSDPATTTYQVPGLSDPQSDIAVQQPPPAAPREPWDVFGEVQSNHRVSAGSRWLQRPSNQDGAPQ